MAEAHAPVETGLWAHRRGAIDLGRPRIMGILNITPDSFSDGGLYDDLEHAVARAEELVSDGADVLDVGGESTRPGSAPLAPETEAARVVPVIRALRERLDVPISVDTRRAAVARQALDAGADIVNDISALADPEMASVIAAAGAGAVLMHMQGTPATMQEAPCYDDLIGEITEFLRGSREAAIASGISPDKVVIDPGIGFGKTFEHNLELIARLRSFTSIGAPILVGPSRKGFLGAILGGAAPADRAVATATACAIALLNGARIFRVHDVRPVREALQVAEAIRHTEIAPF